MKITIDIPKECEEWLKFEAEFLNMTLEEYVLWLIKKSWM